MSSFTSSVPVAGFEPTLQRSKRCVFSITLYGLGDHDGVRTRDLRSDNPVFSRLNYVTVVPWAGFEPATPSLSQKCSTIELPWHEGSVGFEPNLPPAWRVLYH